LDLPEATGSSDDSRSYDRAVTMLGLDLAGVPAGSFATETIFNCVDIAYAYVDPRVRFA
jgi:ABC-type dipeptide/oligopeptide/nickel transport system permease component